MIWFSFSIRNPFKIRFRDKATGDYFYRHYQLTKNKSFEIQVSDISARNLFHIWLNLNWKGEDHAGPKLTIEFGRLFFDIAIYDHRHWDWDTQDWEVYDTKEYE